VSPLQFPANEMLPSQELKPLAPATSVYGMHMPNAVYARQGDVKGPACGCHMRAVPDSTWPSQLPAYLRQLTQVPLLATPKPSQQTAQAVPSAVQFLHAPKSTVVSS